MKNYICTSCGRTNEATCNFCTSCGKRLIRKEIIDSGSYFDMIEYFCNGHDDTAVDVYIYDMNGTKIGESTFSWAWSHDPDEWLAAEKFAEILVQNGLTLRHKRKF